MKRAGGGPSTDAGIYHLYKELAQRAGDPQTARPEPLSVIAKRLGLLRW
jgi:hypothetical protein